MVTTGPHGTATRLIEVFDELGLRLPGSTAIDVDRLLTATADPAVLDALGAAVSGVLAAVVAFTDPETIVVGGPWGSNTDILDAIAAAFARLPRHVPVRAATVTPSRRWPARDPPRCGTCVPRSPPEFRRHEQRHLGILFGCRPRCPRTTPGAAPHRPTPRRSSS